MPPTQRRNGPTYRPPASPPENATPDPSATTVSTDPENGNYGNTIDAAVIYTDGLNGDEALDAILSPDARTGNNQTDCRAAMAAIDEWLAALDARRSVILHVMFNDYANRGDNRARHQRNNWGWVAGLIRHPVATVVKWAHRVECYDALPREQD